MTYITRRKLWICIIAAASFLTGGLILSGCKTAPHGVPLPFYDRSISSQAGIDEVWILSRNPEAPTANENSLETAGLLAEVGGAEAPMPLLHTEVKANVSGGASTVDVTQRFNNPYNYKIEAVYVFPLPHNAAVNDFIMSIGKRRIRGIIRERKEAEQIYEQAKNQGYVATLLTEERPNIFKQSVANIEPGNEIEVNIKYFSTLDYVDGWYEFVFPMVVGPRFNPPGTQTPDINYLKSAERGGHDVSLRVDVDAGTPVEQIECKTHGVTKTISSPSQFSLRLKSDDTPLDRDFILRYRVAGSEVKSSLLTQHDSRGNYFALTLYPPEEVGKLPRQPLELVFVLDCSGSMSGRPIEQAKAAVERGLRLLQPGDSFQLINFSVSASQLGPAPVEATPENVQRALNYLQSLNADDGTMMLEGIKAALDFPHDPKRLRFVCFLTDGYVGNEAEILGEVHKRLGDSRIFSFGMGSSVNRYLLDHMAKAGRGAAAYLGPNDSAAKIMEDFFERTSHPALSNIKIDWDAMRVSEVYPRDVPDLFRGRSVLLTGRYEGSGTSAIHVTGAAGGKSLEIEVPANLSAANSTHKGLPEVWARMKIADLADRLTYDSNPQFPYVIRQVALDYNLVSPFTAFLAVDASDVTTGTQSTTVPVSVPLPQGMNQGGTNHEQ
jgi:Ca-activated chloride channel family protein